MKRYISIAAVMLATTAAAQTTVTWDTYPDTWVTVDELGREVASSDRGVTRKEIDKNAQVGMFYYIWHGQHSNTKKDKDITEILSENPDNPQWGPESYFHWGSTPWLGRYNATDAYKTAKHFQMLTDAGVDFIILDNTNALTYDSAIKVLITEFNRRKKLGLRNLQICHMVHSSSVATMEHIYENFHKNKSQYDEIWYKWLGKPLMLTNMSEWNAQLEADRKAIADNSLSASARSAAQKKYDLHLEMAEHFTLRDSWAWEQRNADKADEWSWLEYYPQNPGFRMENGKKIIEQMSVGVGQHATTKIGKSSHGHNVSSSDKYGRNPDTPKGIYFQEQWDRAIEVHPQVAMVTQFNEWIAQRFIIKNESEFGNIRPGAKAKVGETYFVDVYTPEYSRDLEPSKDMDVRDNYYLQLCSNVRKYRGVNPIPEPSALASIDFSGDWKQWDEVSPEFRDEIDDVLYTSKTVQQPGSTLRRANDIIFSKVAKDKDNYCFLVSAKNLLSNPANCKYWMRLFINFDCDYSTGWAGYDYMCCIDDATGKYSLMRNVANGTRTWKWELVSPLETRIEEEKMMVKIPRNLLSNGNMDNDFDFKWADNFSDETGNPDVMYFISDGEAAPNGRFNYRFKGSVLKDSGIENIQAIDSNDIIVRVEGNNVSFVNQNGEPASVAVYDLVGRTYGKSVCSINLSKGIYICSDGKKTSKFVIK